MANMTGNTVLLGLAVFQNHGDLLHFPGVLTPKPITSQYNGITRH